MNHWVKKGFIIGIIFLLPLFSGCSLFLQSDQTSKSEQKQNSNQKVEEKLTPQQVVDKASARLEQAPGWHIRNESVTKEVAFEIEFLNHDQYCMKAVENGEEAIFCYESPTLLLKSGTDPGITFDLSNPEQRDNILKAKEVIVFLAFPDMFSPKKAVELFKGNSNMKMEDKGDHYLLKTTVSAEDYFKVMFAGLEDLEIVKSSSDLQQNLKDFMDQLSKADIERNYQYNIEVKVDKKQFAVKEIFYDYPDVDYKSVVLGEISKLSMK